MIVSDPCQNSTLYAPEGEMVRKRFRYQNPTPKIKVIGSVNKWYVQYRDAECEKRSKILGPEPKMTMSHARAAVSAIL